MDTLRAICIHILYMCILIQYSVSVFTAKHYKLKVGLCNSISAHLIYTEKYFSWEMLWGEGQFMCIYTVAYLGFRFFVVHYHFKQAK